MIDGKPALLELFCGTKSIGKEFSKVGFKVVSTDFEPRFKATFTADILTLNPHDFAHVGFDALWASPPCNAFSVTVIGRNWHHDHTPKNDTAKLGLKILEKTIRFIEVMTAANPQLLWWFENPRGKMRKIPIVQPYNTLWNAKKKEWDPPNTVSYCQYEMDKEPDERRMKPTDIWTNTAWEQLPICKNGDPCHAEARRGSKTGTQGMSGSEERSVIPPALCASIAQYAINHI